MPLLVGLDDHGFAAVFDVRNQTTKVYDVGQDAILANLDNVLRKLCEYVNSTEVQRMVVSHRFSPRSNLQSFRQKVVALGFTNAHFVCCESMYFQGIVNDKFIRSAENEHVLLAVGERTTLWCYTKNSMKFILLLNNPSAKRVLVRDLTADSDFVVKAKNVIQTCDVRRWFVHDSPKTSDLIRSNNFAIDVVQWDQDMTSEQTAQVALWNAQRQVGMVEGVLVENFALCGPRIEVDGSVIRDKSSKGVALPSQWSSNYLAVAKNITVNYSENQWKFDFKTKEIVKIQLCFDEDGVLDVILTTQPNANILFKNERMYMVASATNAVPDPPVVGPFPTRLRFEKETVTISENASGENILSGVSILSFRYCFNTIFAGILKMLDPSNPAEPGWELVSNHFSAKVCLPDGTDKNVNAQTAASHLLSFAVNKVSLPGEGIEKLFIVLPEDFTEIQCANLTAAASKIGITATIKRELSAVADGYAKKQNLQDEDRIIVVHPTMEGCRLKLFKVSDQQTKFEAEKFDAKMNSEILRQSQRKWEKRVHDSINPMDSGASEQKIFQLEHSSYSVVKGTEPWLEAFRSMLQKLVCAANRDTVKGVILVGADARRLPLLNNLLSWTFLKAEVCTVVEEELEHLAVIGAHPKKSFCLPQA